MAERVPQSPDVGDLKNVPRETAHDVEQSHEHRGRPNVPDQYDEEDDYPVERVEAVYRKIDLRIIPGESALPPLTNSMS